METEVLARQENHSQYADRQEREECLLLSG
jgi:hypothetical protein